MDHALSTIRKVGLVVYNREAEAPMRINTLHNFYEMNRRVSFFTDAAILIHTEVRFYLGQHTLYLRIPKIVR